MADISSVTYQFPSGSMLYRCPLCPWGHWQRPLTTEELIATYSLPAIEVEMQRTLAVESAVEAHLKTHTLLEWVQEVGRLRSELEAVIRDHRRSSTGRELPGRGRDPGSSPGGGANFCGPSSR